MKTAHVRHEVGYSRGSDNRLMAGLFWVSAGVVVSSVSLWRLVLFLQPWLSRRRVAKQASLELLERQPPTDSQGLHAENSGVAKRLRCVPLPSFPGPYSYLGLGLRNGLALAVYCGFICFLLLFRVLGAQKTDLETLAFRSGWLALSQFPFVALLLSQFNVISFATGVSRQRLKWLHRWLARTIFLLSTLHGALFLAQWIPNNFFWDELEIVPRVKHGLVAWAILAWAALSSVGPMRRLSYEFFIFQHMASALGFLLLLYWHIPKNHKFYVHFASAAIISDLVSRLLHFMYRNIEVLPKRLCRGRRRIGYEATVSAVDDDLTVLDVNGVDFSWTPGQYVYVWMPTFWLQSPHPFTIANSPSPGPDSSSHISLVMRTKGGFTKKLNRYAQAHVPGEKHRRLRVFISGPFGNPLSCTSYETLVFISASTGASFTIPVIESLAASSGVTMARRVHVLLVDRRKAHLEIYIQRLRQMLRECMGSGIVFHIKVAITAPPEVPAMNLDEAGGSSEPTGLYERLVGVDAQDRSQLSLEENDFELRGSSDSDKSFLRHSRESSVSSTGWDKELDIGLDNVDDPSVEEVTGRPDLEDYFEEIMDGACGRVAVFVCGGTAISTGVRESLTKVSRNRGHDDVVLHVESTG